MLMLYVNCLKALRGNIIVIFSGAKSFWDHLVSHDGNTNTAFMGPEENTDKTLSLEANTHGKLPDIIH